MLGGRILFWASAVGLLSVFAVYKAVWYDDACHYLVGRTLALHGQEAFPIQPDQLDPHSLFITVGPAVNYPMALAMRLLGPHMWVARAVAVGFSLLSLLGLLALGRRLLRPGTGYWGALLLLTSIQFLVYGTQYLGEGPLICYLLLAMLALCRLAAGGRWGWALVCLLAYWAAILSKEYIALPLGLSLLAGTALAWWARLAYWPWLVGICLLLPLAPLLYYALRFSDWASLEAYWQLKANYSEEFWVWNWQAALRFIALKPLIWLGTLALLIRVRVRRRWIDGWLLSLQLLLLFFFTGSIGYDRFGLLLMPIPALYLGEWLAAIWARYLARAYTPYRRRVGVVLGVVVFFLLAQRTPFYLPALWQQDARERQAHRCMASALGARPYFTYDLQLVPALQATWRLPQYPPSSWQQQPPLVLLPGEALAYGFFAETEYFIFRPDTARYHCGPYRLY